MKRVILALVSATIVSTLSYGAVIWEWRPQRADTRYIIYGGDLGDTYPPTTGEKRVAFYIRGSAAKELFEATGPDRSSDCGMEKGGRVRRKGNVVCRFRPSTGYQCDFGFDLVSGKSIGGSIC